MKMSEDNNKIKTCTRCGEEKPATLEYFVKCKTVKSGLSGRRREFDSLWEY